MNSARTSNSAGIAVVLAIAVFVPRVSNLHADDAVEALRDAARIARLIEQLGSAFFDEREAAAAELRQIGPSAQPLLATATKHRSAEVRSRAALILRQFDMVGRVPLQEAMLKFARQPEEKVDLEEGMWLIARILNPNLERERLTRQLDGLANSVKKKLGEGVEPKSVDPQRIVAVLQEVLFEDERFGGNFVDYQNPDNSSLEKVLESRKGLPILVSHVVIAVARRLEVPIVGLPTAGRYIVKYDGRQAPAGFPKQDIFFDPFNNGKLLSRADRLELFPWADPDQLDKPGTRRAALIRMLNNLESHLFARDETDRGYLAVEFRVALEQHSPEN